MAGLRINPRGSRQNDRFTTHHDGVAGLWGRWHSFSRPLTLRETIARFSFYSIFIAVLWALAYLGFLISGMHRP